MSISLIETIQSGHCHGTFLLCKKIAEIARNTQNELVAAQENSDILLQF
jgi:hypothetical protein